MRENEERLRGITKNIPGTIFQFYVKDDGEYGMSYISERLTRMLGLQPDLDAMFPEFISIIHEEDRVGFLASVRSAVASAAPWNFEGRFLVPSGKEFWFHGMATPTRHEDRLVYDGILLDVTDRKQAEQALERRLVALTRTHDDTGDGDGQGDPAQDLRALLHDEIAGGGDRPRPTGSSGTTGGSSTRTASRGAAPPSTSISRRPERPWRRNAPGSREK
ncbi:MAG: PAS domain-containing protein, partial [Deltaproteobacteria bacterium]|nr:PAS domain-containing protein [Deltaproteobacteria bacterium]